MHSLSVALLTNGVTLLRGADKEGIYRKMEATVN